MKKILVYPVSEQTYPRSFVAFVEGERGRARVRYKPRPFLCSAGERDFFERLYMRRGLRNLFRV